MKRFATTFRGVLTLMVVISGALAVTSCSKDDVWNDVPGKISSFINRYYPFSQIESFEQVSGGYFLRIDDGPGFSFDTDYGWTAVDGYGLPLPQVMLFDQLPGTMYRYLEETSQLNAVFGMERNSGVYTLDLMSGKLRYDSASGQLSGS